MGSGLYPTSPPHAYAVDTGASKQSNEEGLRFLDARRAAGGPAFSFTLTRDDEFEEIRRRGPVVVSEPREQEYGGTDALIEDGVGNIICLHRD